MRQEVWAKFCRSFSGVSRGRGAVAMRAASIKPLFRHRGLGTGVDRHSATISPDPPISAGKSFIFGSPSRIGSTVSV